VHQFSKLKKLKVLDDDELYIGHITDILFHGDGTKTLVVSGSNLAQLFDRLHIINHKEMLIPTKFITFITSKNINLSVNKDEIIKRDHISLYKLINRDFRSLQTGFVDIGSRYKYLVYETNLAKIDVQLKKRTKKIEKTLQDLTIKEYDPTDDKQTKEFVKIYNEIALSSVDPYEAMNDEIISEHFKEGSFIAYRFGKPAGYVILVTKDEDRGKVAAIAGIGIHHKARRKGLSTAFVKYIVDWLRGNGEYVALQADILSSNVASIGLFTSLSFTNVDEFFLY
ncbi:MAG: GNAT family N-acetyltransferase, partial [Candidatus Heimdallarchaeota archaeon]|nr:GNAT family N-acetyltransferase [Candidatus Heimdallarchaeota archaeon]